MNNIEQVTAKFGEQVSERKLWRLPKYKWVRPTAICNIAKLAWWTCAAVERDCIYNISSVVGGKRFVTFISSSLGIEGELGYVSQAIDFGAVALEFWHCSGITDTVWAHFASKEAELLTDWQEQISRREPIVWLNRPTEDGFSANLQVCQNPLAHIGGESFVAHKGLEMLQLQKEGIIALYMSYPSSGSEWLDAHPVIVVNS